MIDSTLSPFCTTCYESMGLSHLTIAFMVEIMHSITNQYHRLGEYNVTKNAGEHLYVPAQKQLRKIPKELLLVANDNFFPCE